MTEGSEGFLHCHNAIANLCLAEDVRKGQAGHGQQLSTGSRSSSEHGSKTKGGSEIGVGGEGRSSPGFHWLITRTCSLEGLERGSFVLRMESHCEVGFCANRNQSM